MPFDPVILLLGIYLQGTIQCMGEKKSLNEYMHPSIISSNKKVEQSVCAIMMGWRKGIEHRMVNINAVN